MKYYLQTHTQSSAVRVHMDMWLNGEILEELGNVLRGDQRLPNKNK